MLTTPWHFWDAGERPGAEQMAIDSALLERASRGEIGPVFRVYGWQPPAVSLGFNQDPAKELDIPAVQERGYDIVKRPTGGRAILHIDELTYSVVASCDDPVVGGSIRESHCRVSRIFRDALRTLDVPAHMAGECGGGDSDAPAQDPGLRLPGRSPDGSAPPCFATAAGTELVVSGRKILGSAQRRHDPVFLQHGSLLLGDGHLELAALLRLAPPEREAWRRRLDATTTSVQREIGRRVSREEAVQALAASLGKALDRPVQFTPVAPPGLVLGLIL
jgi:lipoate-protein ligase A